MVKFDLGDDNGVPHFSKYRFGDDIPDLRTIEHEWILFSYEHVSLKKTKFCFNNQDISQKDFWKYFEKVKYLSKLKVGQIFDDNKKESHLHEISGKQLNTFIPELKNIFKPNGSNLDFSRLPIIAQYALYTEPVVVNDDDTKAISKAPRFIFYIGNNGIFNILFLDLDHLSAPMKFDKANG